MESLLEVWASVAGYLRERIAYTSYDLFIAVVTPASFDGERAVLSVKSNFQKGILDQRFAAPLREAFFAVTGLEVKVEVVAEEDAPPVPAIYSEFLPKDSDPAGLYAFTFDTFIVGSSNKFAHAAALAVAANPSGAYNPLFIYGGSGLGKTHLLLAIMAEIKKNHADYNIIFAKGEDFTNELIAAIQTGSTPAFRDKFRQADALLIDDIQFIGGKEQTQEEFFHTFNTLYQAGKQIVLTSDRPPKEIKSLEERLRTRFEWGLLADIQAPDFETRIAIIRRKAELLSIRLPDEVAEYIANKLKSNIRQLEGAVRKIKAYNDLTGSAPSIALVQAAIRDTISEDIPYPVTVEKVLTEVARTYGVSPEDIRSKKRAANISAARKISAYILREITGMSMADIGRDFGGRDHSTIVYAVHDVEEEMIENVALRETIEDIIKNIKST